VVKPKPPRRRRIPFLVASFVVVGSLVTAVVTTQALVSQTSFRMEELNREASELRNEHGRLMLSVAELSSPERVYHEALRLGLRHPSAPPVVVFVPDESGAGGNVAAEGGS
jgi:cell division protein FtsL